VKGSLEKELPKELIKEVESSLLDGLLDNEKGRGKCEKKREGWEVGPYLRTISDGRGPLRPGKIGGEGKAGKGAGERRREKLRKLLF